MPVVVANRQRMIYATVYCSASPLRRILAWAKFERLSGWEWRGVAHYVLYIYLAMTTAEFWNSISRRSVVLREPGKILLGLLYSSYLLELRLLVYCCWCVPLFWVVLSFIALVTIVLSLSVYRACPLSTHIRQQLNIIRLCFIGPNWELYIVLPLLLFNCSSTSNVRSPYNCIREMLAWSLSSSNLKRRHGSSFRQRGRFLRGFAGTYMSSSYQLR